MKHIHFIGICGVAMSALAIAFHKRGYTVSGSDKGFYPPVSTHLKKAGISYYPGWHPEKMGTPDLVIVGNVAGSKNPEWLRVQEKDIPFLSYPEAIAQFFVKDSSIVCAGTYGKTSTSALLSWIFLQANKHPSYMFGALSLNDINAAQIGDGDVSILEGDEYKSARWDMRPKFAHYSPTHLLLTAVEWDHADVYKTEKAYIDAFQQLIHPETITTCIASERVKDVVKLPKDTIIYGEKETHDFRYTDVSTSKDGISFTISHNNEDFLVNSPLLGTYMADNMTAAFAMSYIYGIDPKDIVNALQSFKGIKRRLEKRFTGHVTIIDDIAHSPAKALSTLQTLKNIYTGRIIAIFEPNTGNRKKESENGYHHAFKHADEVIIPRLTKLKVDPDNPSWNCEQLTKVISQTHSNAHHIHEDGALVDHVLATTKKDDVVVFLGSHGFRGMIEELVKRVSDIS